MYITLTNICYYETRCVMTENKLIEHNNDKLLGNKNKLNNIFCENQRVNL